MSIPKVPITLPPGFSAIVTGIVNSDVVQKAFIEVMKEDVRLVSTTFSGQGVRVPLKSLVNDQGYWTVGPFDFTTIINVEIISVHHWQPKDPIIVKGGNPLNFVAATVIAENPKDEFRDDCTVQIIMQLEWTDEDSAKKSEL
ncbi:hypothetical protein BV22DRAFT_1039375 [Leucogyrophana mollusca]|uniref:Uncharacterized protein n=1 Tax=Leucogyrophana mollusca TaxID=85980 RepID=A0ACB8B6C7_9AGAM|nr:hypothetical protein BV22DRAFT_1039375 [Leucogyrophana mollusca]